MPDTPKCRIVTYADCAIDPVIVSTQKKMFARIGIEIDQHLVEGTNHEAWIDEVMAGLGANDSVLFVDIDCFAENIDIVERGFAYARRGGLFGCAQAASHLAGRKCDYAGPMFLCISKRTWLEMGSPSAAADEEYDVCARWSDVASRCGVPVKLLRPTSVAIPLWSLADGQEFGIGTWYDGGVFHLFEARKGEHTGIFLANAAKASNVQTL